MSQENVEIVRRFLDAYSRGDRGAVGALLHPEIEWHSVAGPLFGLDAPHGREESLRFMFEQAAEVLDDFRVVSEEVSALPDGRVLSIARYEGQGTASGAPVEMISAAIYAFEAGMIRAFREYASRADALEAAGLREPLN
jgi:ketosteroid isomerase-like protein